MLISQNSVFMLSLRLVSAAALRIVLQAYQFYVLRFCYVHIAAGR